MLSRQVMDPKGDSLAAYSQAVITHLPVVIGRRQLSQKNFLVGNCNKPLLRNPHYTQYI
jgi:hypothetical protein